MISRKTILNLLRYFIFMAICIAIILTALCQYVPPEILQKTIVYTARDIIYPEGDIVIIRPLFSDPTRFQIDESKYGRNMYNVSYAWSYEGQAFSYQTEISQELFEFYQNKDHERRDYAQYAVSEYDRALIQKLASAFSEHALKNKYTDDQIALNVLSFAHTIPYSFDIDTKGIEEYPRYPVETLIEGGDCEDRAILAAAILYELDIDCILIHMQNHMALGLKDNGHFSGQSYRYEDTVYYYAGMTDGESGVGTISSRINPTILHLYPIVQKPILTSRINSYMVGYDKEYSKYLLEGDIQNKGTGHGKNVTIRVVTELKNTQLSPVPDQLILIGDIDEDYGAEIDVSISVPKENGMVTVYIEGDNFDSYESDGFYFNFAKK